MKKFISILVILSVVMTFVGCKKQPEKVSPVGDPSKVTGVTYVEKTGAQANEKAKIGEDEVRIYIPANYLQSTIQSISDDAKTKGAYDVTVYSDGSIAYLMSRSDYDKMISDIRTAFEQTVDDFKQQYSRVYSDIKHSDDYSHFDFYAESTSYVESGNTTLQETLFAGSTMFQLYLCKDPASIKMTYTVYDNATGDVIEMATYPDDLAHS